MLNKILMNIPSAIELVSANRYAYPIMPITANIPLADLMIVDDDPLICEGLASAFDKCYPFSQATSRDAVIERLCKLPASQPLALIEPMLSATRYAHDEAPAHEASLGIIGQSPLIKALRDQIALVAALPYPILIEGESGCGKELVAIAIQKLANHPHAPFKVLNCAAISPALIETTLFGHCKGAFTGASAAQAGFFEDASGGTLFLDEIGEMPLELQTKLLRVLENGEYQRIGETSTRKSQARIIAATNRNLRAAIKAGLFRNDLYHRLNIFSITVPPLRELGMDKQMLLEHFRKFYAQQIRQTAFELDELALQCWQNYHFPGNTRELRNIVIRLCAKYPGKTVHTAQLQQEMDSLESAQPLSQRSRGQIIDELGKGNFNLDRHLLEQQQNYIAAALQLATGNISVAAKLLGLNRTTLHSRMDAHEKHHL